LYATPPPSPVAVCPGLIPKIQRRARRLLANEKPTRDVFTFRRHSHGAERRGERLSLVRRDVDLGGKRATGRGAPTPVGVEQSLAVFSAMA
jgi:hypothetical protein